MIMPVNWKRARSLLGHSRRFLDIQLTASPTIAVIGVRRSERREGPTTAVGTSMAKINVEQGSTRPKVPVGAGTHGLRVSENSLSAVFGVRVRDSGAFIEGPDEAIIDQLWNFDCSHADIVRCHDLLHLLQRRARGIRLGL